MGRMLGCECTKCGYEKNGLIGRLRHAGMMQIFWPAVCNQCEQLVFVDYSKYPLICSECSSAEVLPIDHPSICKGDGTFQINTWPVISGKCCDSNQKLSEHLGSRRFDRGLCTTFKYYVKILIWDIYFFIKGMYAKKYYCLTDGHYKCPHCKEMSLIFPEERRRSLFFS